MTPQDDPITLTGARLDEEPPAAGHTGSGNQTEQASSVPATQEWRVGSRVPLNVYKGDRPICQCHDRLDAADIVDAMNRRTATKVCECLPRKALERIAAMFAVRVVGSAALWRCQWCNDTRQHHDPERLKHQSDCPVTYARTARAAPCPCEQSVIGWQRTSDANRTAFREAAAQSERFRQAGVAALNERDHLRAELAAVRERFVAERDDARRLLDEAREALDATARLTAAMETCHMCHSAICIEDGPIYCESCSSDCEDHEDPNCPPIGDIHSDAKRRASAAITKIDAARKGVNP